MEYPHVDNRLIRNYATTTWCNYCSAEFLVEVPCFRFRSPSSRTNETHYIVTNNSSSARQWMQSTFPIIQFLRNKNASTQSRCYRAPHLAYIVKCCTCFPPGDFSLIFSAPPPPPTRRPIRTIRSAPASRSFPFLLSALFHANGKETIHTRRR